MVTKVLKRVNRGTLKKAAREGRLMLRCRYHYTDDYAFDAATNFGKMDGFVPAWFGSHADKPEGVIRVDDWLFRSSSGRVMPNADNPSEGWFSVHSNLVYDYRILAKGGGGR